MKKKHSEKRTVAPPRTVLRRPDLDQAKSAVLNSLSSTDAQRGCRHAIEEFIEWYCSEPRLSSSKSVVLRYRIHLESRRLAPGKVNLRFGSMRRLAYEASDCGLLSPELTAGIRRVKRVKKIGVRLGNWLTPEQSQRLWNAPDFQELKANAITYYWRSCSPVGLDGTKRSIWISVTFSSGRNMGNRRPEGQGRPHQNNTDAGLG